MHELEHKCLDLAICIQRNIVESEEAIELNINKTIHEEFLNLFGHEMEEQHAIAILRCAIIIEQRLTSQCCIWDLAHELFHELFQSPEGPSH